MKKPRIWARDKIYKILDLIEDDRGVLDCIIEKSPQLDISGKLVKLLVDEYELTWNEKEQNYKFKESSTEENSTEEDSSEEDEDFYDSDDTFEDEDDF